MKVSILVPVYGVEKYIEKCAVSLFDQTYEDVEYVFVDDCTPDNSMQLLEAVIAKYPDKRAQTKLVRHDKNSGLGAARKTALNAATGDFVLNVDSDDFLSPDAVERLVAKQKETDADVVTGCIRIYRGDDQYETLQLPTENQETVLKMLLIHHTVPHNLCGRLVRRTLFTENGISPEEGVNQAEDYAVTPRLFFCAKTVATVSEPVYHYQIFSAGSFSDQISPRHVESFLKANQLVVSFFQAHDTKQTFRFAMETGMLNTYYDAMKVGLTVDEISRKCHYKPSGLFSLLHLLTAHPSTLRLLRFSYLTIKWLYKRWLRVPY